MTLGAFGLSFPHAASAQVTVATQNGGNERTGANLSETALTPSALASGHFGKLFTISGLDANVNGQVLYVPNVTIGGAVHNALYAYQSDNADNSPSGLAAFDADTGALLWRDSSSDASPIIPVSATYTTATPVIDTATGTMYVLTKNDTDDTGQTYIHAIDITTGREKPGSPVLIDRAQVNAAGTGDGNVNGRVYFDGPASSGYRFHANDRPALLLSHGIVYAAFAHNSDSYPYHGWIVGYKYAGSGFTLSAVFCTTPNGGDGGIWMAGKGLTADSAGNIYCSVGNGTFDADSKGITSGTDYGMCYLKLSPSLQVLDWFSPHDEASLSNADLDTGNSGVTVLPGTNRLFGGATKFGTGFLLDSTDMGHFTSGGPDHVVLRLDGLTGNDSVGQNPICWDAGNAKYVYLWANGSNLEQFAYDLASGTFLPAGVYKQTSNLTSGGSLAVTSDGSSKGIVWAVGNDRVVRAFDATDVSKPLLWSSALNSSRDSLPSVGHFQFPTVANGKVYVPTGSASIAVYGLLSPVWTARAIAASPEGGTHVLWTSSTGTAALWKIGVSGQPATETQYGPFAGWTARALAVGSDGNDRLLWTHSPDNQLALWSLDAAGHYTFADYGPFSGWMPLSIAVGADNLPHILWNGINGQLSLWNLDASGSYAHTEFGPYPGWQPQSLAIGPNGTERVLWQHATDNQVSLWSVTGGSYTFADYGPFAGWSAQGVAVGSDNLAHLFWDGPNGIASFWTINAAGQYTFGNYGPFSGWTPQSIAVGANDNLRVIWQHSPDGQASLWDLNSAGHYTNTQFGPPSGS